MKERKQITLKLTARELMTIVHALTVYSVVAPRMQDIMICNVIMGKIVDAFKEFVEQLEKEVKK